MAMKSQMEADRAEQQRIKNLVLNYELQDSADQDGIENKSDFFMRFNPNLPKDYFPISALPNKKFQGLGEDKHQHNASLSQSSNHATSRSNGTNRGGQRARKLQLSDVDWYDKSD